MSKSKIQNWNDVDIYTTITFSNDDITVIFKNIDWNMFVGIEKEELLKDVVYKFWWKYGLYENIEIKGRLFKMISKTKRKVELLGLYDND